MRKKHIYCCGERVNEISLRYNYHPNRTLPKINDSNDAKLVMKQCFEDDRIALKEFFFVMYISRGSEVLAISCIGVGTEAFVPVSIKEIVSNALLLNAYGVIVAHNHPGGNLEFSACDMQLSTQLMKALNLFRMNFLDHLIFTKTDAVSLHEKDSEFFESQILKN